MVQVHEVHESEGERSSNAPPEELEDSANNETGTPHADSGADEVPELDHEAANDDSSGGSSAHVRSEHSDSGTSRDEECNPVSVEGHNSEAESDSEIGRSQSMRSTEPNKRSDAEAEQLHKTPTPRAAATKARPGPRPDESAAVHPSHKQHPAAGHKHRKPVVVHKQPTPKPKPVRQLAQRPGTSDNEPVLTGNYEAAQSTLAGHHHNAAAGAAAAASSGQPTGGAAAGHATEHTVQDAGPRPKEAEDILHSAMDASADEVHLQADEQYAQRLQEQEDAWHAAVLSSSQGQRQWQPRTAVRATTTHSTPGSGGIHRPWSANSSTPSASTRQPPGPPAPGAQPSFTSDSQPGSNESVPVSSHEGHATPDVSLGVYTWRHPAVFDGNLIKADLERGTLQHDSHLEGEAEREDIRYASRIQLLGTYLNSLDAALLLTIDCG